MSRVHLLPEAVHDLSAIWQYVVAESRSVDAANRVIKSTYDKCAVYAIHPQLGEPRDDLLPELRCCRSGSFVIFYLPTEHGLDVLQIIHGAQDIPAQFRR